MTTSLTAGPAHSTERHVAVAERTARLKALAEDAHGSLRLWRVVLYSVGLAAVVAASAAGASILGDIWGSTAAGFLALAAAVLASVDKFLSAGDKITKLDRRWQGLQDLSERTTIVLSDAVSRESRLDPTDPVAVADYDKWLTDQCASIDAEWQAISDRQDRV
jgi:hypothetical protein